MMFCNFTTDDGAYFSSSLIFVYNASTVIFDCIFVIKCQYGIVKSWTFLTVYFIWSLWNRFLFSVKI